MVTFVHEQYLYAAWLLPVLIIIYIFNIFWQDRMHQKLGDKELVDQLLIGRIRYIAHTKFALLVLAYTCFVLGLANPQLVAKSDVKTTMGQTDIVFAIDVSNSMLTPDIIPNRLTQAKQFMLEVTNSLNGEQVGIVLFAGKAYPYLPLTADYKVVHDAGEIISTDMIEWQGTSLGDALKISGLLFNRKLGRTKVICVLSDGESHTQTYAQVADSLSKAGVHLFSYGIGTTQGSYIPDPASSRQAFIIDKEGNKVISKLNEESLVKLVGNNAERYQRMQTNATAISFTEALKKLPSGISVEKKSKKEYWHLCMALALILLVLELLIPSGKKVTTLKGIDK